MTWLGGGVLTFYIFIFIFSHCEQNRYIYKYSFIYKWHKNADSRIKVTKTPHAINLTS